MFPEAGGSAALARHAFNELASFLTGWAMCLALVALAALSAAFVPRYLSVFWAPLATSPWAVAGAPGRARPRRPREHPRPGAVGQPGGVPGHRRPRGPAPARAPGRGLHLPAGAHPGRRALRVGAVARGADPGLRRRDGRLHRDRDDRRHGRRGARSRPRCPDRDSGGARGGDHGLRGDRPRRPHGHARLAGRLRPIHHSAHTGPAARLCGLPRARDRVARAAARALDGPALLRRPASSRSCSS